MAGLCEPRRDIVERNRERCRYTDHCIEAAGLLARLDLGQIALTNTGCEGKRVDRQATMLAPDTQGMRSSGERSFLSERFLARFSCGNDDDRYVRTCKPCLSIMASSLSAMPLGRLAPVSHFSTVLSLVLR